MFLKISTKRKQFLCRKCSFIKTVFLTSNCPYKSVIEVGCILITNGRARFSVQSLTHSFPPDSCCSLAATNNTPLTSAFSSLNTLRNDDDVLSAFTAFNQPALIPALIDYQRLAIAFSHSTNNYFNQHINTKTEIKEPFLLKKKLYWKKND